MTEPEKTKSRRKLPLFRISLAVLLLGILWLVNSPLPGEWVRGLALDALKKAGWDAQISKVRLGPFLAVRLSGVRLKKEEMAVDVARAELELGLWQYFMGDAHSLVRRLDVDQVTFRLVQKKEKDPSAIKKKSEPPSFDFAKLIPASFSFHGVDVYWSNPGGDWVLVENLHLSANDRSNGLFSLKSAFLTFKDRQHTFEGLRGITAWRNLVFYLADVHLAEGVVIDNLSADFARILSNRIKLDTGFRVNDGSARVSVDLDSSDKPLKLSVSCWVGDIPLPPFSKLLQEQTPTLSGTLKELKFNFRGSPGELRAATGSLVMDVKDFQWKDRAFESLHLATVLSDGWMEVYDMRLAQAGNELQFRGESDLPANLNRWIYGRFSFDVTGKIRDAGAIAALVYPGLAPLTGEADIAGYATGREGKLRGKVSAKLLKPGFGEFAADKGLVELQFNGSELRMSKVELARGADWIAGTGMVDITGDRRYSAEFSTQIANTADYAEILPKSFGTRLKAGSLSIQWNGDGTAKSHTGGFQGKTVGLHLAGANGEKGLPLDAEIEASYSPETIVVRRLQLQQADTWLEAAGSAGPERLAVDPIRVRSGKMEWGVGSFDFPFSWSKAIETKSLKAGINPEAEMTGSFKTTKLDLAELVKLSGRSWPVTGVVNLDINLSGVPANPLIAASLKGSKLSYQKNEQTFPSTEVDLKLDLKDNLVSLGGRLDINSGQHLTLEGSMPFDAGEWWTGDSIKFREQPLTAQLRIPPTDVSILKSFIPKIRRFEGKLEGSLDVSNTLGDPRMKGYLNLRNLALQSGPDAPAFEDITGAIEMEGADITLGPITGKIASGPFELSGKIKVAGKDTALDIVLRGERLLIARNESLRLRTNADIALKGTLAQAEISGTLELVDGRFYRNLEINFFEFGKVSSLNNGSDFTELPPPFKLTGPPFSDWTFDVRIRNASPFQITGNFAKGEVVPDLILKGKGSEPYFTGQVDVLNAKASLPFSKLSVDKALVYFDEKLPRDPVLDVKAHSLIQGYRVDIVMYGRMSKRNMLLRSDPPLAQEDIVRLLTTGLTPTDLQGSGSGRAAIGRGGLLFMESILRKLGIEEEGLFEQITVDVRPPSNRSRAEIIETTLTLSDRFSVLAERDDWGYFNGGLRYTLRFK